MTVVDEILACLQSVSSSDVYDMADRSKIRTVCHNGQSAALLSSSYLSHLPYETSVALSLTAVYFNRFHISERGCVKTSSFDATPCFCIVTGQGLAFQSFIVQDRQPSGASYVGRSSNMPYIAEPEPDIEAYTAPASYSADFISRNNG